MKVDIRQTWIFCFWDDPATHKKSGLNQYSVLCPFHAERHPSCDVSLEKNVFICRSCGAKGGALDTIILAGYAQTRSEAAKWLEARGAL